MRETEQELLYQGEIEWLKEQLLRLQRDKFGPSKEHWQSEEQNVLLFNEAEVEAAKPDDSSSEDSDPTITVESFVRKRGKRKALPSHLPREIVNVELPANERFDADGRPLKVVGKQVSEKFVFEPAVMKVIEYHRFRYGVDSGDPIKTAPPVPIDHSERDCDAFFAFRHCHEKVRGRSATLPPRRDLGKARRPSLSLIDGALDRSSSYSVHSSMECP